MKRVLALVLVSSFVFVSAAAAQPGTPTPTPAPTPAQKEKPRVKVLDMGAIDVQGDTPTGELVPIGVRELATSTSLIRIRHDFIDMILKTAQDLP